MTGDNGLRDAVAKVLFLARHSGCEAQRDAVLALPAIREALAAVAQRDAARALHIERDDIDGTPFCTDCLGDWPCPTVRALSPTSPEEPT